MRAFPGGLTEKIDSVLSRPIQFNLDVYEEIYSGFCPLQRKNELRQMMRLARAEQPSIVFEIGAANGGGIAHWCLGLHDTVKKVIASELRIAPYKEVFEKHFPWIEFLWLDGNSRSKHNVDKVIEFIGQDKINVMFLDGDKKNFSRDFATYLPYMDGVIFFHDIQHNRTQLDFEGRAKVRKDNSVRILDTTEALEIKLKAREHKQQTGEDYKPKNAYESWLLTWGGKGAGVGVIWHHLKGATKPMNYMDQEIGKEIFLELTSILDYLPVQYFLIQGTALGAYRDKGFTPTEKDIDIGFSYYQFRDHHARIKFELENEGYEVEEISRPFTRVRTMKARKKGISVDLVSFVELAPFCQRVFTHNADPKTKPYALVHPVHITQIHEEVELFGRVYKVPSPIEEYLEREYGEHWKTPADDSKSRTRVYDFMKQNKIEADYYERFDAI